MHEFEIGYVGPRIKQLRLAGSLKLIEVAANAGVSKGLLSRIENGRVSPSLPVLFAIIEALHESPASFFGTMKSTSEKPFYLLKRESEYRLLSREDSTGFHYFSMMSHAFTEITFTANLLLLEAKAEREPVVTNGMEFIYLISGEIVYHLGNETFTMCQGDALFFDGRVPHVKTNHSEETAKILVLYFLFST